jgi:hypothetical protein
MCKENKIMNKTLGFTEIKDYIQNARWDCVIGEK